MKEFCTTTVDAIKPKIVLASGDLTDAKDRYVISSSQYEEEWRIYSDVLHTTGVLKKVKWIDIRGNHDNFNVPALLSTADLFMKYSVTQKARSYMEMIEVGGIRYGKLNSFNEFDESKAAPQEPKLSFKIHLGYLVF